MATLISNNLCLVKDDDGGPVGFNSPMHAYSRSHDKLSVLRVQSGRHTGVFVRW
ncbi:hypothetical protein BAUCODRAFT_120145 [Baudoinia panamericana UAMH 10762]|uniref:Uncharacterized protein n=1 Tax=Baudoinia panamericana (strain UAMH 10762) TaxID=717646 RepID=M2LW12_BAUPA|nr:uncharacterized protein BAUCODRAFT_120145 [Baudoinia panamericana UAMH 10762]EMC98852.1 hypothetical protein BAUCODRAFT_120145 [Baudoinia panamericana UAMH 10762]